MIQTNKPIKIGFDLDGVLLYNPARLARPVIKYVKQNFLGKKKVSFFVPKTSFQTFMWDMAHKSSLWIAPGIEDIYGLVDEKKIEAYIVTGRFKHLKDNTEKWINKLNRNQHFKKWYYNQNADQPHLYKEAIIKKNQLDIFIDDNWDIVNYLNKKFKGKTKIYWVYNLLDRCQDYPHKYPSLKKVIEDIQDNL